MSTVEWGESEKKMTGAEKGFAAIAICLQLFVVTEFLIHLVT